MINITRMKRYWVQPILRSSNISLRCAECNTLAKFTGPDPRRVTAASLRLGTCTYMPVRAFVKFQLAMRPQVLAKNRSVLVSGSKAEANSGQKKSDIEVAKTPARPRTGKTRLAKTRSTGDKTAKIAMDEMEQAGRKMNFNKNLISFLEIQVFTKNNVKAYKTLAYYRGRNNSHIDVAAYNVVIHGYASVGDWPKSKEVFQMIINDKLKPTPQSFAGILECLGRMNETPNVITNIKKVIGSLGKHGYKLDDIFNKCTFEKDQREVILSTIRRAHAAYQPKIMKPKVDYVCPLLMHLNNDKAPFQSPCRDLVSLEELNTRTKLQLQRELEGSITIKSIERKDDTEESTSHYRKKVEELERNWSKSILESLERNLNSLQNQTRRTAYPWAINLYPYLRALNPEEYVKIILLEIRKLAEGSETYSPSVSRLHREIGHQVLSRFQVIQKKEAGILKKIDVMYQHYTEWYLNPNDYSAANVRERWQDFLHTSFVAGPTTDAVEKSWSPSVITNIGKFLYRVVMRDVKIDANVMKPGNLAPTQVPAFYSIFRMQGSHLKEEIKPHPVLVKLLQAASRDELTFPTTLVPMECPPLPWASVRTGGYLLSVAKLVRLPPQSQHQLHRMVDANPADLFPALDSLNQLGSIPWKINENVLDVIIEVFNNKGNDSIGIPPPPSECPSPPVIDSTLTKEETMAAHKQRLLLKRRKAEMYSLWCDGLYRFSLANHFRKRIFWLPHNMDFRGRVYPCPPHLSHLGADPARSLLVFAQGEKLGPEGLNWLKIHLINLTGLKKRNSLEERLQYANEIIDDIMDSAEKPLTGRKWWMESDEPWQTLACAMEIRNAVESGDPESYISHFPIHQDGSCNGLQHYAALGRDQAGAESVNLSPSAVPQDVYSAVAALVEKQRAKDAEDGVLIAKKLEGFIARKVIKQTVMTTVYGVTRYGARLQIAKQLKDLNHFPQDDVWAGSLYLTHKTFESLQEMFTSTKEIQDWFTECARLISQVCGQTVEWITPIGLPVVQPYFKASKRLDMNPGRLADSFSMDCIERPNVMKQKNAFPPNYIHSLDSTHMMLTSLHCERAGITFVSVHDCYWTHPVSVGVMSRICREQFVALHSQPILEDLSKFLFSKYSYKESELQHSNTLVEISKSRLNNLLKEVPPKGAFDLRKVLDSVYFFS